MLAGSGSGRTVGRGGLTVKVVDRSDPTIEGTNSLKLVGSGVLVGGGSSAVQGDGPTARAKAASCFVAGSCLLAGDATLGADVEVYVEEDLEAGVHPKAKVRSRRGRQRSQMKQDTVHVQAPEVNARWQHVRCIGCRRDRGCGCVRSRHC